MEASYLTHPVFVALDAQEDLKVLIELEKEILLRANATTKKYVFHATKLCEKIQVFMTHRGFHVDQKTFAGWKLALTAADAQEAHFEKIQTEMQLKLQQAQASKVESEFNMTQIQRSLQSAHQTIQNLNKQARLQDAKVVEKDLHWKKLDAEKTQLIKALQKQTALQKQVEASVAPILLQQHQIFPEEEQVDISPVLQVQDELSKLHLHNSTVQQDLQKSKQVNIKLMQELESIRAWQAKDVQKAMLVHELDQIRKAFDHKFPCSHTAGPAWQHVLSCGALATASTLKEHILSQLVITPPKTVHKNLSKPQKTTTNKSNNSITPRTTLQLPQVPTAPKSNTTLKTSALRPHRRTS